MPLRAASLQNTGPCHAHRMYLSTWAWSTPPSDEHPRAPTRFVDGAGFAIGVHILFGAGRTSPRVFRVASARQPGGLICNVDTPWRTHRLAQRDLSPGRCLLDEIERTAQQPSQRPQPRAAPLDPLAAEHGEAGVAELRRGPGVRTSPAVPQGADPWPRPGVRARSAVASTHAWPTWENRRDGSPGRAAVCAWRATPSARHQADLHRSTCHFGNLDPSPVPLSEADKLLGGLGGRCDNGPNARCGCRADRPPVSAAPANPPTDLLELR